MVAKYRYTRSPKPVHKAGLYVEIGFSVRFVDLDFESIGYWYPPKSKDVDFRLEPFYTEVGLADRHSQSLCGPGELGKERLGINVEIGLNTEGFKSIELVSAVTL